MGGVFGIADPQHHLHIAGEAGRMSRTLARFPWYQIESYVDQDHNVAIGRVGIGIFNAAPQPVWNADHTVALVMAGEISPTAADNGLQGMSCEYQALSLYEKYQEDFIHQLEGAFVIAIYDRQRQLILVCNDRFGLYPTYYAVHHGRLVFAPEMQAVLQQPGVDQSLDLVALAEYIRFQTLLGDKTFFEGIKLLPNASTLRFWLKNGRLAIEPYWDFAQIPELPRSLNFKDAAEEYARLLKASVDKNAAGEYRLGVYLSGGLDSRVILGMLDRSRNPVTTISFGLRNSRDVHYAHRIAQIAGSDHHYFEFTDGRWVQEYAGLHLDLTEGFHSWIHSHGISILPQARSLIDIDLTGFGGAQMAIDWNDPALLYATDELSFATRLHDLLSQKTTWPSINDVEERVLFAPKIAKKIVGLSFDSLRQELKKYEHLSYLQRARYFGFCNPDRRLYLYYTVFHRSHIELRFPFLDYRYFEFVYALPPEMLYHRRLRREVIARYVPALRTVPYSADNLPIARTAAGQYFDKFMEKSRHLIHQRFQFLFHEYTTLYADYENWLRQELKEWGWQTLLGEKMLQKDLFQPEMLTSLWMRHQSGLEEWTIGKLAPIMTYQMLLNKITT